MAIAKTSKQQASQDGNAKKTKDNGHDLQQKFTVTKDEKNNVQKIVIPIHDINQMAKDKNGAHIQMDVNFHGPDGQPLTAHLTSSVPQASGGTTILQSSNTTITMITKDGNFSNVAAQGDKKQQG